MSALALRQETYLPGTDDNVEALSDFLDLHGAGAHGAPEPRYFLTGAEPDDRVELPAEIYRVLRQVVEALHQGHAVTVAPITQTLTTQQAADLLGVSRPTVIKLLDDGKMPYERNGTHRRILLRDLLAYRDQRRAEQYAALEATGVDLDDEDDLNETLQQLRDARHAGAERRRRHTAL
ncbi:helix-turn-helix domain-containing protein [Catenuloplanes sp. NPDC051500]|uniref:helix-turn-helix domain-containing protein n=1 Tax=Catenuloplanes sp. NPDC051500 TaxID=3363959 RepID=UPI0037BA86E2